MLYCNMQLSKIDASNINMGTIIIYNTIIAGNDYSLVQIFVPILNIRTAQDSDVEPIVIVLIFG